jgi:hypothetical protein
VRLRDVSARAKIKRLSSGSSTNVCSPSMAAVRRAAIVSVLASPTASQTTLGGAP